MNIILFLLWCSVMVPSLMHTALIFDWSIDDWVLYCFSRTIYDVINSFICIIQNANISKTKKDAGIPKRKTSFFLGTLIYQQQYRRNDVWFLPLLYFFKSVCFHFKKICKHTTHPLSPYSYPTTGQVPGFHSAKRSRNRWSFQTELDDELGQQFTEDHRKFFQISIHFHPCHP